MGNVLGDFVFSYVFNSLFLAVLRTYLRERERERERDQQRGVGRVSGLLIQKTDSSLVKLLILEKRVNTWSYVRGKCWLFSYLNWLI